MPRRRSTCAAPPGCCQWRIVYYYHSEAMPLYLLTVFGKNEKANLSKAERNDLAKLVAILKSTAGN